MTLIGGVTTDQLDVSDLQNPDGSPIRWSDVTVSDDGSGNTVLTFPEGETVTLMGVDPASVNKQTAAQMGMPCLAAGTLIDTPGGRRRIESLRPGDLVTTPEGPLPVVWAGGRSLGPLELRRNPSLRPVLVRRGALGNDRPLAVSGQHALLLAGPDGGLALARAGQLARLGLGAFRRQEGCRQVAWHHLLLPRHALIRANGAWTESLWPGPRGLGALGPSNVAAILAALPGIAPALADPGLLPRLYGPRLGPMLRGVDLRAMGTPQPGDPQPARPPDSAPLRQGTTG